MKEFFSIGDVAEKFQVNTHVIRNWCEKFPHLHISKGLNGRRYFTQTAIEEIEKIQILIEKYGMSINGIIKLIKHDKIKLDLIIKDFKIKDVNENKEYNLLLQKLQQKEIDEKINLDKINHLNLLKVSLLKEINSLKEDIKKFLI